MAFFIEFEFVSTAWLITDCPIGLGRVFWILQFFRKIPIIGKKNSISAAAPNPHQKQGFAK